MTHLKKQINFPSDWINPMVPAYGTFPWPFNSTDKSFSNKRTDDYESICLALEAGYRHIDTAFTYGNQQLIGKAVSGAGILRNEIYVTSKLHPYNNFYKDARLKIQEALQLIWGDYPEKICYLDCFLLHYPGTGRPLEAWKAMQEARDQGLIKHIGVSNFEIRHLEAIKKATGEFPEINQIEFHPWLYREQAELVDFCHKNFIALEGYSPLAQCKDINNPAIIKISRIHNTTPARIIMKWCMQHHVKPVFGSRNPDNIRMNANPYDFILSENEMQIINKLSDENLIRVAEQWGWNPQKAGLGGRVPGKNPIKKFIKKSMNLISKNK